VGDFNGDGHPDLVVADAGGSTTLSLLLGNGDGTFQAPLQIPAGGEALGIAAGHFHNPNILDLVTLDEQDPNSVTVLLGNGNGTFKPPVFYPVGQGATSVAAGDLRGNGINDLVVTNGDDNTVSVLLGNGNVSTGRQLLHEQQYPGGQLSRVRDAGEPAQQRPAGHRDEQFR
jgi:hypothetical protein